VNNPFGRLPELPIVIPFGVLILTLMLWRLRASGRLSVPRALVAVALAVYAAGVAANTVFPIYLRLPSTGEKWVPGLALRPFYDYEVGDAVMNMIVFFPAGILIALVLARPTWLKMLACIAATSLAIELIQLAMQALANGGHIADVNDVIFNVLGGLIGYGVLRAMMLSPWCSRIIERFRWTDSSAGPEPVRS
jgi:glycopeptide antibiotics resistance protein